MDTVLRTIIRAHALFKFNNAISLHGKTVFLNAGPLSLGFDRFSVRFDRVSLGFDRFSLGADMISCGNQKHSLMQTHVSS